MTLSQLLDLVAAALLFAGGVLALGAAIGVLRFPDMVTRMHAGAKPLTLGLVLAVGGLALTLRDPATLGLLVLIVGLQVMTVPVSAHMVARVAYRSQVIDADTLVVDELAEDLTGAGYDRVVAPSSPDTDATDATDATDNDAVATDNDAVATPAVGSNASGSASGPEPGVDEPVVAGAADEAFGDQVAGVDDDDREGDVDQEGQRPPGDESRQPMSPPQQGE